MKKSNKILAVVMALVMMLTAVPMMTAGAADEHVHLFKKTAEVKANCKTETNGSVTYACACGMAYDVETEEFAHKLTGSIKEDGALYHKQFCDTCETYIQTKHTFVDVKVTEEATCNKYGKKDVKCSVCGYEIKNVVIAKVPHTFTSIAEGDITNTTHKGVCTVCKETVTELHIWGDGVVTATPKCTTAGEMTYTCTVCKKEAKVNSEAGMLDLLAVADKVAVDWAKIMPTHTYGAWKSADDDNHVRECACGQKDTKAHNFVVVVGEKSVCDDSVALTITCEDCDYKLEAKATQHDLTDVKVVNGKHEQECKNCKKTFVTDHAYDEGKVTVEATCFKKGVKTFTCACGATKTEEIAMLEHKMGDWKETKPATFTEKGEKERACTVKGCEYKETEEIAKLEYQVGDVNGDGKVQALDARLILQHIASLKTLTEAELARADVTGDGAVKATDARKILRIVAGLEK